MKELLITVIELVKNIITNLFYESRSAIISISSATYGSVMYNYDPPFPESLWYVSVDQALQRTAWALAIIVAAKALIKSAIITIKRYKEEKRNGKKADN